MIGKLGERWRGGGTNLLVAPLSLLFAYLLGRAVVQNPGVTLGPWLVNLAPAMGVGGLLLFLLLSRDRGGALVGAFAPVSLKHFFIVAGMSLLTGFAIFGLSDVVGGLTYWILGLVTFVAFVVALTLVMTGSLFRAMSLFVLLLPLVHFFEYEARVTSILTPTAVLLWLFSGALIIRLVFERRQLVRTVFDKYVLFFCVTLVYASLLSSDPVTSLRTVFYISSLLLFFPLVVQCVRSRDEMIRFLIVVAATGVVRISSLVYFAYFKPGSTVFDPYSYFGQTRWHPTWIVGPWFILALPLCFAGLAAFRRAAVRLGCGAALVWTLVASLPIVGRSTSIGAALVMLPFVLLRQSRRFAVGLFLVAGLGIVALLPVMSRTDLGRFEQFESWDDLFDSQTMRLDAWRSAVEMMRDHPATGIGPGLWRDYIPLYASVYTLVGVDRAYIPSAHHIILQQGATTGVGGLVATLALALVMVWRGFALVRIEKDPRRRPFALGLLSSVIMFWVLSVTGGRSFDIESFADAGYFFWLFLGLIAAWDRIATVAK